MPRLTTPYESLIGDIPYSGYPRPQLVRDSYICLNGKWDFEISSIKEIPKEFHESILVPYPPESPLSGIERGIQSDEYVYYRR